MIISFRGSLDRGNFERMHNALLPWWSHWAVFPIAAVVATITLIGLPTIHDYPVILLAVAGAAIGYTRSFQKTARAKSWESIRTHQREIAGEANDQQIIWKTPTASSTYEWKKFVRLEEREGLALAF